MLYRILYPLTMPDNRIEPAGQILDLAEVKNPQALIDRGAILPIEVTPPLIILDGWQYRARRLRKASITTVGDLLEANEEELSSKLNIKVETVQRWKKEALTSLLV